MSLVLCAQLVHLHVHYLQPHKHTMASLLPLPVSVNADGWGPIALPEKFQDLPYVPFGKGDKLGKVADWGAYTRQGRFRCTCAVPAATLVSSGTPSLPLPLQHPATVRRTLTSSTLSTERRKRLSSRWTTEAGDVSVQLQRGCFACGRAAFEPQGTLVFGQLPNPPSPLSAPTTPHLNVLVIFPPPPTQLLAVEGADEAEGVDVAGLVAVAEGEDEGVEGAAPLGTWAEVAAGRTRTWPLGSSASCWPPTTTSASSASTVPARHLGGVACTGMCTVTRR